MKHKDMIFVFGSNLEGIHGGGAAKMALQTRGAQWGKGEGLMGTCYALPTKVSISQEMTLDQVFTSVSRFIRFTFDNPSATFLVTQVGCGLGGFVKEEIAPLFTSCAGSESNCLFDTAWTDLLPEGSRFWGTYP